MSRHHRGRDHDIGHRAGARQRKDTGRGIWICPREVLVEVADPVAVLVLGGVGGIGFTEAVGGFKGGGDAVPIAIVVRSGHEGNAITDRHKLTGTRLQRVEGIGIESGACVVAHGPPFLLAGAAVFKHVGFEVVGAFRQSDAPEGIGIAGVIISRQTHITAIVHEGGSAVAGEIADRIEVASKNAEIHAIVTKDAEREGQHFPRSAVLIVHYDGPAHLGDVFVRTAVGHQDRLPIDIVPAADRRGSSVAQQHGRDRRGLSDALGNRFRKNGARRRNHRHWPVVGNGYVRDGGAWSRERHRSGSGAQRDWSRQVRGHHVAELPEQIEVRTAAVFIHIADKTVGGALRQRDEAAGIGVTRGEVRRQRHVAAIGNERAPAPDICGREILAHDPHAGTVITIQTERDGINPPEPSFRWRRQQR